MDRPFLKSTAESDQWAAIQQLVEEAWLAYQVSPAGHRHKLVIDFDTSSQPTEHTFIFVAWFNLDRLGL